MEAGGDNLNMQNVVGDLRRSIQEKKSELYQCDSNIADHERQLQILDVSLNEKTEANRDLSTKLAGAISTLESVNKKRDDEMMLHSNLLRKLQVILIILNIKCCNKNLEIQPEVQRKVNLFTFLSAISFSFSAFLSNHHLTSFFSDFFPLKIKF